MEKIVRQKDRLLLEREQKMRMEHKPYGVYEKYLKRLCDIFCGLAAVLVFWWLYVIVAVLVRIKLGSPIIFTQYRPGKDEKIFRMYKFRTMTDQRDENGILLPDEQRLTRFGSLLRKTSLDELPEVFNILKGDMSVIGPRPQLVRDMVFMSDEERLRHSVRPGLSGLAQVSGRNEIPWEDKLFYDLVYIERITFFGDLKIIFQTIYGALIKQSGITEENQATATDLGDYLLRKGKVSQEEYDRKQAQAAGLLKG